MSEVDDIYFKLRKLILEHKYSEFIDLFEKNKESIDIDAKDKYGNYFLTYAVMFNNINLVNFLIENGARLDVVDSERKSLLIVCIKNGFEELVEKLLEHNVKNVGINILNMKDNNGILPLHLAISERQYHIVSKLIAFGANPNATDFEGLNSLHIAVQSRSLEMCKLVGNNIKNINAKSSNGETALHFAVQLQLYEICQYLISKGIDVNIVSNDYELSALHYSAGISKSNIFKLLLESGSDINSQNLQGNTCLHYILLEHNINALAIILNIGYSKINFNLWNLEGNLPLHTFLTTDLYTNDIYLEQFVVKTNLTIQNVKGESCLHYITKLGLWKKISELLSKQKIDIFAVDKAGNTPISYVASNDVDEYLDIAAKSYFNVLQIKKKSGKSWSDQLDIMCSDFTNSVSSEKERKCRQEIIIKLKKIYDEQINADTTLSRCEIKKSYPETSENLKMICSYNIFKKTKFCTYTGSILDILVGLIYVLGKFNYACSPIGSSVIGDDGLNFEVLWTDFKIKLPPNFFLNFSKCLDEKKKKFVVIPLGIDIQSGSHANFLIYDSEKKELERFEPHGATMPIGLNYDNKQLDIILENKFKQFNSSITYVKPSQFLPRVGFQLMDNVEFNNRNIGDPGGFCALWSIWYVEMRLAHFTTPREKLVTNLIKYIKSQNLSFRDTIRNYSHNITELRDNILNEIGIDINDWLNENYTKIQFDNLVNKLNFLSTNYTYSKNYNKQKN